MPIKKYRPVTKGRRFSSVQDFSDVTRNEPEKSLIIPRKAWAGRTNGKITVRHKGGGVKRYLRVVDFVRSKFDIPAKVDSIEYDPGRGARIALVIYKDGAPGTPLIAYLDTAASGLPVTPNSGDISITWSNGTNKIFKL